MRSWASARRTSRASSLPAGRARAAAVALGLAGGAATSVLGFLAVARWWPPRLAWAIRPLSPPAADWLSSWSPDARSVAAIQTGALDASLAVAAGLALLLLCAGLLHLVLLLLAEGAEMEPEWALRAALGATNRRLRRERLARGIGLALVAGSIGLGLGAGGRALLRHLAPAALAFRGAMGGAALWTLAGSAAAVIAATRVLSPKRRLVRRPAGWLGELAGPRTGGSGSGIVTGPGGPLGWTLAAGQVAAAVIVGTAALLLVRGAPRAAGDASAYPYASDTLLFRVRLGAGSPRAAAWSAVRRNLLSIGGVRQAAVSSPGALLGLGPLDRVGADCPWCSSGEVYMLYTFGRARHVAVGPGFFDLAGWSVSPGGGAAAGAPPPGHVVVDPVFRARLFQGRDPTGRQVWTGRQRAGWDPGAPVAGVVRAPPPTGLGAGGRPEAAIYFPALEHAPGVADVAIRAEPGVGMDLLRDTAAGRVAAAAPGSRVRVLGRLDRLLDERGAPIRWLAGITAGLALLCLLLASRSVADALSARVRARAAELGLRRAVGARRRDVLRLVLADAGRLVAAGTAAGVIFAASLDRGLPLLVGGVTPLPATALLGVAAVMAAVAFGAAIATGRSMVDFRPATRLEG